MKMVILSIITSFLLFGVISADAQGPGTMLYDRFGVELELQPPHGGGENNSFYWPSFVPAKNTQTVDWTESDWYGNYYKASDSHFTVEHEPADDVDNDYYSSGGEAYDVEALYFDNDASNLYFVIITSVPHFVDYGDGISGVGVYDSLWGVYDWIHPGDISINILKNQPRVERYNTQWCYDYGIDIVHENRSKRTSLSVEMRDEELGKSLYKTSSDPMAYSYIPDPDDSDWYTSTVAARISAYYEHTNFDPYDANFTGSYIGETDVNYYEYTFPGGELENGFSTYVIEITVPRYLLGDDNPEDGDLVGFRFASGCRNDGNSNTGIISLFGTVDEEETDLEINKEVIAPAYTTKWSIPISKGEQWEGGDYWLRLEYNMPSFDVWGIGNLKAATTTVDTDWHHIAGRYTIGDNTWGTHTSEILLDGQIIASRTDNGIQEPTDAPLLFGSYLENSFYYAGAMDEIRLSSVARSDNWLRSTAQMLAMADSFASPGTQEISSILNFKQNIYLNTALISGNLTNFPVVVQFSDNELAKAVSSQEEICFTLTDGTILPTDIERYESGKLTAWIRVPFIAQDEPCSIVMHYGGLYSQPNSSDVWDDDFKLVQHFAQQTSNILKDSTAYENNTHNTSAIYLPFGVAGGTYAFDGVDDYMITPSNESITFSNSSFTVEGWFARKIIEADAITKITLYNNGEQAGKNVQVRDYLEIGKMSAVAYYAENGTFDPTTEIWSIENIAPKETATLWIAVDVDGDDSVINTVEIISMSGKDLDSTPNNLDPAEDDMASVVITPYAEPYDPENPGQKPDFNIEKKDIQFIPANPVAGQEFKALITVHNKGDISCKPGKISVWLDYPAGEYVPAGTIGEYCIVPDSEIPADGSKTFVIRNMKVPAAFGYYSFLAYADSDNEYAEYSEGNNQGRKPIECYRESTGKPDFKITSLSMPAIVTPGTNFTVLATISNEGDFDAEPGTVAFFLHETEDASTGDLGDASLIINSVIKHGESKRVTYEMTAPTTNGFYLFRAFVDAEDQTVETSEGNNQANFLYEVRDPSPDFRVSDISFSETPTAGEPFTSYVTIENIGNAPGIPNYVDVEIIGSPDSQWTAVTNQLESGESLIVPVDSITPTSSDVIIKATVDPLNQTEEQSKDNNSRIHL